MWRISVGSKVSLARANRLTLVANTHDSLRFWAATLNDCHGMGWATLHPAPTHGSRDAMEESESLLKSREPNAADGLEITLDDNKEQNVLHLKGRLGLDSSPTLRDRLLATLQVQTPKAVVVDLTELSSIDASGVATLLEALKVARHHKSTLSLMGLQGRLLRLFEVTGVLHLFESDQRGNASSELKVP